MNQYLSAVPDSDHVSCETVTLHEESVPAVSLLVVDAAEVRVSAIKRWARTHAWLRPIFTTSAAAAVAIASEAHPEIALVDLLFAGGRGVALAIELKRLSGGLEAVLVVEDVQAPEVEIAFGAGCGRLVHSDGLTAWLDGALRALARLVTAERQLAAARRAAEELADGNVLPSSVPSCVSTALPLAVAERRHREAYLRAALAQAGSRREAAALAGIPYTTFCVMLRKLGINP
jgi:DNA-binding NarL/FixJ family response regulator